MRRNVRVITEARDIKRGVTCLGSKRREEPKEELFSRGFEVHEMGIHDYRGLAMERDGRRSVGHERVSMTQPRSLSQEEPEDLGDVAVIDTGMAFVKVQVHIYVV